MKEKREMAQSQPGSIASLSLQMNNFNNCLC